MSTHIYADTNQMRAVAQQVEGHADTYKTEYEAVYGVVEELKAHYDGADYLAFANQLEGFHDDFQRMEAEMRAYAEYLRTAANDMDKTQADIEEEARRLSQGSGPSVT